MFSLSFDSRSLSELAQMHGLGTFLTEEVGQAMQEAGSLIEQTAVNNTWAVFAHPTGALASSIGVLPESPFEVQVGVGVPYGRRREYGFSGMTDSLGRFYANDPAKPYMQPALDSNQQAILQLLDDAIARAFARIGG